MGNLTNVFLKSQIPGGLPRKGGGEDGHSWILLIHKEAIQHNTNFVNTPQRGFLELLSRIEICRIIF